MVTSLKPFDDESPKSRIIDLANFSLRGQKKIHILLGLLFSVAGYHLTGWLVIENSIFRMKQYFLSSLKM